MCSLELHVLVAVEMLHRLLSFRFFSTSLAVRFVADVCPRLSCGRRRLHQRRSSAVRMNTASSCLDFSVWLMGGRSAKACFWEVSKKELRLGGATPLTGTFVVKGPPLWR